jgi:hypothetical protein
MLTVWTAQSGYSFGSLQQQIATSLPLPVANDAGVVYRIISGELPSGLFVKNKTIIGSPFIVNYTTKFEFCIRASATASTVAGRINSGTFFPGTRTTGTFLIGMKLTGTGVPSGTYITSSNQDGTFSVNTTVKLTTVNVQGFGFADRTFFITVISENKPEFITAAGLLPVGPNQQLYITDQTYIEYQLEVVDLNVETNQQLNFFISEGDGSLPPGLTLSNTGLISGYILQAPKVTLQDGTGHYDKQGFDYSVFDFGLSESTLGSQTLNLNYKFKVTVTDGIKSSQRTFKIFVVGSDEFRADTTTSNGLADEFTADSTYVRKPQWRTNSYLGLFRSNNYLTVPVALYDNTNVVFRLELTNHETYAVAYQISGTDNIITSTTVTVDHVSVAPKVGQWFTLEYYLEGAGEDTYQIINVEQLSTTRYRLTLTTKLLISIPNNTAFYIGSLSKLPIGVNFDPVTGDVYGMVPYQPAVTEQFKFTVAAARPGDTNLETISTSKTFNLIILGNIHSQITWISNSNLGVIPADYTCTLSVLATTTIASAVVTYTVVDGNLPTGLTLKSDGEIIGIPNQFNNSLTNTKGIISFDLDLTTFDRTKTTFDRIYKFVVEAADQYGYSAIRKEFAITISKPNNILYNNIVARPFLIPEQRTIFSNFINNSSVFPPASVYRPNDPNFGIQSSLSMIIYAGIESQSAASYVAAMSLNTKKKRFQFKNISKAVAVDPDTNQAVYEVVYMQMIDPLEPNGKHLPLSIKSSNIPEKITADLGNDIYQPGFSHGNPPAGDDLIKYGNLLRNYPTASRPDYNITVDSTGYEINTPDPDTYFPSSITNWQTRLSKSVNSYTVDGFPVFARSERNYLPLWMRSIQASQKEQLGYLLAVPLCFCKVGTADTIILNIKFNKFDFAQFDYTIDRFTLSSAAGYNDDKYLVFKNNRTTI